MNLQDLNKPLPKPWLNINSNTLNTNQLLIAGQPVVFPTNNSYNASITAGTNLSNIAGAQVTEVLNIGNIYNISGSFTASVAASINNVSFSLNLPSGTTSTLNNYRSCLANAHINGIVGFLSLNCYDLANGGGNSLVVSMQTCTSGNEPAAISNNVKFNYSITFTNN